MSAYEEHERKYKRDTRILSGLLKFVFPVLLGASIAALIWAIVVVFEVLK